MEDRVPLLSSTDDGFFDRSVISSRDNSFPSFSNEERPWIHDSIEGRQPEQILCVFVVAFDIRAGNIIEWCIPDNFDLPSVEFKAMASGSHRINKDFIYFKTGNLYGLACFENMPVESEIERGARMKSVGVLSLTYTSLYKHLQFLEVQVRQLLEFPGKYDDLANFYEEHKGNIYQLTFSNPVQMFSGHIPELKIIHPEGCFSQFLKFFGASVFVLWKFILLRKRVIFFSPPPIGIVCYRVYCAVCLASHNIPDISDRVLQPLFYINVADIDALEYQFNFVACTTEKIFEAKPHLYDVYVDNQNVKTDISCLKDILTPTPADKERFRHLDGQKVVNTGIDNDEESMFITYFTELNNQLFHKLLSISRTQDKQLTSEQIKSLGLDPVGDRQFLMELLEVYGIDVMLLVDNACCPSLLKCSL